VNIPTCATVAHVGSLSPAWPGGATSGQVSGSPVLEGSAVLSVESVVLVVLVMLVMLELPVRSMVLVAGSLVVDVEAESEAEPSSDVAESVAELVGTGFVVPLLVSPDVPLALTLAVTLVSSPQADVRRAMVMVLEIRRIGECCHNRARSGALIRGPAALADVRMQPRRSAAARRGMLRGGSACSSSACSSPPSWQPQPSSRPPAATRSAGSTSAAPTPA
jgi:hypothetical protein